MKLDPRTVIFIIVIGSLLMSSGLFAVTRSHLGQVRGLSRWAAATAVQMCGWIVFGILRPVLPELISIVIGNGLVMLSLAMYLMILAQFNQKTVSAIFCYGIVALQMVLQTYFLLNSLNLAPRIIINSSLAAILMLKCVHVLLADKANRPASHSFTAGIFMLCGVFLVLRGIYYLCWPTGPAQAQFSVSTINDISYLIFYSTAIFITFGFVLMCNDRLLGEQKQALATQYALEQKVLAGYDALQAREMQLRRLMNSSLIGIIEVDARGALKEANDVLLHMTGYRREDLQSGSMNWFKMTSATRRMRLDEAIEVLLHDGVGVQFESELMTQGGGLVPIMLGLARLEGSQDTWVGFVVDLREQRRIDHLKSEFISIVSHELRTPLTSIRGALGILEGGVTGALPDKAMQLIKIAHKNSQRLVGLVNDILDMEKLASGKMSLHMQRINLTALAHQALEANAAYAEDFQVQYVMHANHEEAFVLADGDRLMQVFANLLSNAAKFSPRGGQVEISVINAGGRVRVAVTDHGKGIPAGFRDHIFGKFAQADVTATRHLEGAGLGLHITKTLVEKMGGELGFDSKEGAGSVFWFVLRADDAFPSAPMVIDA
jgi:PAS domain S-box-containing protein